MLTRGKTTMATVVIATIAMAGVPPVSAAGDSTQVALRGRFAGARSGHDLVVSVYALPDDAAIKAVGPGGHLRLYRLPGSAVSVDDGAYAVRIAPRALPANVRAHHEVTFQVVAQDPASGSYGVTTATVSYAPSVASGRAAGLWPRATRAATGALIHAAPKPVSARPAVSAAPAGTTWGRRKDAWATIGASYPAGGQKSWMVYNTDTTRSRATTLGVAVSAGRVGANYSQRGTKIVGGSFGFTWDPSRAQRRYQIGVRYRHALVDLGPNPTTLRYLSEWVPISFNGGTNEVRGIKRPHWNRHPKHCVKQGRGKWHRGQLRGHDYEKSGGVHLIFADASVSSRHQYNRSIDLWYHSLWHQRLCGNNAVPLRAGAIMQMAK